MSDYKAIAWLVCSTGALAMAGCDGGLGEPNDAVAVTTDLSAVTSGRAHRPEARLDDRERLGKLIFED